MTDCRMEYDDGPNEYCDTHDVLRDSDETRCDTARMLAAEAAIQRVRKAVEDYWSMIGDPGVSVILRALDGGAE